MDEGQDFEDLIEDVDYSMGQGGERARMENQMLLDELERKKRARTMAVPTDDGRVRARLREIGEPITLFGERAADRRDRLKYVLSQIQAARGVDALSVGSDEEESDEEQEEEFYTPGSMDLLDARRRIADFSLPRAMQRIQRQKGESQFPLGRVIDLRKKVFGDLKTYAILGTQIGDERPISQVRFSPDSKMLATGSWSGTVKVWGIPRCNLVLTLRGHSDKIGGVAWHPQATVGQSEEVANLASGGAEGDVMLWSLKSEQPLTVLKGHGDRVCRVAFHPSGQFVGSASYDGTWRLWDVERPRELLTQEGHSKEVYSIEFQDDGSLVASGGLDAIGRVWDLRTGRTAMVLDGHMQAIYSIDFSPNGHQIATGSGDDTIRLWDMRSLRAIHTIPAHKSTVSDVRFFRGHNGPVLDGLSEFAEPSTAGLFLASAGYDGFVKIWSADDWQLIRSLPTDAGKVMSVDLSRDAQYMATGSWNRSYQLFAPDTIAL